MGWLCSIAIWLDCAIKNKQITIGSYFGEHNLFNDITEFVFLNAPKLSISGGEVLDNSIGLAIPVHRLLLAC